MKPENQWTREEVIEDLRKNSAKYHDLSIDGLIQKLESTAVYAAGVSGHSILWAKTGPIGVYEMAAIVATIARQQREIDQLRVDLSKLQSRQI